MPMVSNSATIWRLRLLSATASQSMSRSIPTPQRESAQARRAPHAAQAEHRDPGGREALHPFLTDEAKGPRVHLRHPASLLYCTRLASARNGERRKKREKSAAGL